MPAIHMLPRTTGIGLRASHYREVLQYLPALGWVEVHSEFFGGGAPLHTLLRVCEHYPISLHGVGLGLASPDAIGSRASLKIQTPSRCGVAKNFLTLIYQPHAAR